MRLFITVNMDEKIKEQLNSIIPAIRSGNPGGNYVSKENLHITMLFLGEVPENQLEKVALAMERSVKGMPAFKLWLENLGSFSQRGTKTLWAGVKGDLPQLQEMYNKLIKQISENRIPFDAKEKYTPHVTIARKVKKASAENEFPIKLKTESWRVNSLELYQSIFSGDGVKYKRIISKKFADEE